MLKFSCLRALRAALAVALVLCTACDAPESGYVPVAPQLTQATGGRLLTCPASTSREARGVVLPLLGGALRVGGTTVGIPGAALTGMTEIEIEVPASPYLLVNLRANGQEHWQFLAPLVVTIDYSRCPIGLFDGPVTVWHIDSETGELLEPMGGLDNRLTRTITFVTDHFSGYAIAN